MRRVTLLLKTDRTKIGLIVLTYTLKNLQLFD